MRVVCKHESCRCYVPPEAPAVVRPSRLAHRGALPPHWPHHKGQPFAPKDSVTATCKHSSALVPQVTAHLSLRATLELPPHTPSINHMPPVPVSGSASGSSAKTVTSLDQWPQRAGILRSFPWCHRWLPTQCSFPSCSRMNQRLTVVVPLQHREAASHIAGKCSAS